MTDANVSNKADSLGPFIRAQRELAKLSLRQLSSMAEVSNAYLSQIERGLHEPSLRVLMNVAEALGLGPEVLLSQAGVLDEDDTDGSETAASTTDAILADPRLSDGEKQALISVYRSYVGDEG